MHTQPNRGVGPGLGPGWLGGGCCGRCVGGASGWRASWRGTTRSRCSTSASPTSSPAPPPRQGPAGTPPADGVRGEDGGVCGGRTVRLLDDEVRGWVKAAEGGGGGREGRDVYQDGGSRAGIPHRAATCSHVCMCAHCTRVRDEVLCMCPRFYTCRPPSSAYLRESQEQGIF